MMLQKVSRLMYLRIKKIRKDRGKLIPTKSVHSELLLIFIACLRYVVYAKSCCYNVIKRLDNIEIRHNLKTFESRSYLSISYNKNRRKIAEVC